MFWEYGTYRGGEKNIHTWCWYENKTEISDLEDTGAEEKAMNFQVS